MWLLWNIDEQLALQNLLNLDETDFAKMRAVEDEIMSNSEKYFIEKSQKFEKFLAGRTIRESLLKLEDDIEEESKKYKLKLRLNNKVDSEEILKEKIKILPENKMPIIIAGGSFNAKGIKTFLDNREVEILEELLEKLDSEKVYFVIGHKVKGYEKEIIEISKRLNKNFEIYAIVPKMITKENGERLMQENIEGIRISTESEEFGIYKSFNYEIFERRSSVVIALDGNSPVLNLVQEAKNGKGKSRIFVNVDNESLKEKANYLQGYVTTFKIGENIVDEVVNWANI